MDREQFKSIWLPLGDDFYRYALSILKDEAQARDAVQDLYIKLWNGREALEQVKSPPSWGTALLKNICIDRLRRLRQHPAAELPELPEGEDAQQAMIGREKMKAVEDAVGQLPEKLRSLIRLRYYEDLSIKEIAEKTGLSGINIRVLLSRARAALEKNLKNYRI